MRIAICFMFLPKMDEKVSDAEVMEVGKVLGKRRTMWGVEYLIKWKGRGNKKPLWLKRKFLKDSLDILRAYNVSNRQNNGNKQPVAPPQSSITNIKKPVKRLQKKCKTFPPASTESQSANNSFSSQSSNIQGVNKNVIPIKVDKKRPSELLVESYSTNGPIVLENDSSQYNVIPDASVDLHADSDMKPVMKKNKSAKTKTLKNCTEQSTKDAETISTNSTGDAGIANIAVESTQLVISESALTTQKLLKIMNKKRKAPTTNTGKSKKPKTNLATIVGTTNIDNATASSVKNAFPKQKITKPRTSKPGTKQKQNASKLVKKSIKWQRSKGNKKTGTPTTEITEEQVLGTEEADKSQAKVTKSPKKSLDKATKGQKMLVKLPSLISKTDKDLQKSDVNQSPKKSQNKSTKEQKMLVKLPSSEADKELQKSAVAKSPNKSMKEQKLLVKLPSSKTDKGLQKSAVTKSPKKSPNKSTKEKKMLVNLPSSKTEKELPSAVKSLWPDVERIQDDNSMVNSTATSDSEGMLYSLADADVSCSDTSESGSSPGDHKTNTTKAKSQSKSSSTEKNAKKGTKKSPNHLKLPSRAISKKKLVLKLKDLKHNLSNASAVNTTSDSDQEVSFKISPKKLLLKDSIKKKNKSVRPVIRMPMKFPPSPRSSSTAPSSGKSPPQGQVTPQREPSPSLGSTNDLPIIPPVMPILPVSPSPPRYDNLVKNLSHHYPNTKNAAKRLEQEPVERRVSVRHSESAFKYKEIVVKKCQNYTQIWLFSQTKRKNALNPKVFQELIQAFHNAKFDDTRVVLLTGSGRVFCSGIDLHYLTTPTEDRRSLAKKLADSMKEFLSALIAFPKPVVAAVNGPAVGLGVSLLPLCDVIYASDKASFFCPYTRLAQTPEGASSFTFPQAMGLAMSNELLLSGRKITALEAYQIGLVSQVFWPTTMMQEVIPRLQQMAATSAQALEASKVLIRSHLQMKLQLAVDTECQMLVDMWASGDCKRACLSYIEEDEDMMT